MHSIKTKNTHRIFNTRYSIMTMLVNIKIKRSLEKYYGEQKVGKKIVVTAIFNVDER